LIVTIKSPGSGNYQDIHLVADFLGERGKGTGKADDVAGGVV
jgi:hypothetical protein